MNKLLMIVLAAMCLGAMAWDRGSANDLVTPVSFAAAEAVWPVGLDRQMNVQVVFRAPLDMSESDRPVLKVAAWYTYRITLNGRFVAFGPIRSPKGFARADELDLSAAAQQGRNDLVVEVAGYNVPNYYLMEQPPFLKAEVVLDGRVIAATRVRDGEFCAVRAPRVQKVPRYSFQRTFTEHYRLPGPSASPMPLAKVREPVLIPRRAAYPAYETSALMPLSVADVRVDATLPVVEDRSLTLPSRKGWFKGFEIKDLELNLSRLGQNLAYAGRRSLSEQEKSKRSFVLSAGKSLVADRGLDDTGFPSATVKVMKPGRLVLSFDELLVGGEVKGVKRYPEICNVAVWDFEQPGTYSIATFEPYTMRYVDWSVLSGEIEISDMGFRSYKNPLAGQAAFRSSNRALERIFKAAVESFRQNAVDGLMDCPSRERAGWNCDAYFTSAVSTLLTGGGDYERIFLENFALPKAYENLPDGMLPMCYPADHRDGIFIPNWAMWFALQCGEYLQRTGDRTMIDALRPKLEKLVAYLRRFRNADGLLEKLPGWVFVDWSHSNALVQDVNYPSNMTWAEVLETMDRLYGKPELAAEAKHVRAEILRQSWNGTWFCDNAVRQKDGTLRLSGECTETCQCYAFFHRIATPQSHPRLWRTLLDDFGPQRYDPKNRRKLLKHWDVAASNAFVGNYLRLSLLVREGLGDQLLREAEGYFSYMAEQTGTLWEHDTPTGSCSHGFASYATVLILRGVMGMDVDLPKKTVLVRKTDANVRLCQVTLPIGEKTLSVSRMQDAKGEQSFSADLPPGWKLVQQP